MGSGANLFAEGQRVSVRIGDDWRAGKVVRAPFEGDVWIEYRGGRVHVSKWLLGKCVRPIAIAEPES